MTTTHNEELEKEFIFTTANCVISQLKKTKKKKIMMVNSTDIQGREH
jgi:hypothetical protein